MKITTGIDIIEVARIQKAIQENGEVFLHKIYTEEEIDYCNKTGLSKYQHFAARFAVKEAVFKAISAYIKGREDALWTNIEVRNNESGKPVLNVDKLVRNMGETVDNFKLVDIDISISHIKEYAVASAVAVFE